MNVAWFGMVAPAAKVSFSLAFIFFIFAYIRYDNTQEDLNKILKGLLKIEESARIGNGLRVAVGFGSCEDLIVSSSTLLERLGGDVPNEIKHHHLIHNTDEFLQMFTYFFRHGAAAEWVYNYFYVYNT